MVCRCCKEDLCKEECLLAKASYCCYCASYGHFSVHCQMHCEKFPKKIEVKRRIDFGNEDANKITLCRTEKAINAFLYFWKLSVSKNLETNVKTIKKFCKGQGWCEPEFIEPCVPNENVAEEEEDDKEGKEYNEDKKKKGTKKKEPKKGAKKKNTTKA